MCCCGWYPLAALTLLFLAVGSAPELSSALARSSRPTRTASWSSVTPSCWWGVGHGRAAVAVVVVIVPVVYAHGAHSRQHVGRTHTPRVATARPPTYTAVHSAHPHLVLCQAQLYIQPLAVFLYIPSRSLRQLAQGRLQRLGATTDRLDTTHSMDGRGRVRVWGEGRGVGGREREGHCVNRRSPILSDRLTVWQRAGWQVCGAAPPPAPPRPSTVR